MRQMYNQKWYRPREIAQLGLIQAPGYKTVSSNYTFILRLIKAGKLRAKNYSSAGKQPYWLVPESEIARYHDTVTKV